MKILGLLYKPHNLVGEATRVVSTTGAADEITGAIVEVSGATTKVEGITVGISPKRITREGGDPTLSSEESEEIAIAEAAIISHGEKRYISGKQWSSKHGKNEVTETFIVNHKSSWGNNRSKTESRREITLNRKSPMTQVLMCHGHEMGKHSSSGNESEEKNVLQKGQISLPQDNEAVKEK
ncbi:hypothetical protein Tco_0763117 [Tanacetum coccineum]